MESFTGKLEAVRYNNNVLFPTRGVSRKAQQESPAAAKGRDIVIEKGFCQLRGVPESVG